jgi:hypothetical protein
MKKPVSRAARFEALCRESAKLYGVKVSDNDVRVQRRASIALALEAETTKLIEGRDANVAAMLQLEEALKAITPVKPIEVKVQIMNPPKTRCPDCGCTFDPERADEKPAPPRQIDGKAVEVPLAAKSLPAPAATPVAPPPTSQPRGVHASEFHDQQLSSGEVPPIKRSALSNDGGLCWSGYMDGRRQYGTASPDPHPYLNSDGSDRTAGRPRY